MLRPLRSPHGFTLVELMVLIGIIGLLAAIAVPSFYSYNRASRLDSAADVLVADLAQARATSIMQGRRIQVQADHERYAVVDQASGDTLRTRDFPSAVRLNDTINLSFHPRGSATPAPAVMVLTLDDGSSQRQITVQPTGIAEVAR